MLHCTGWNRSRSPGHKALSFEHEALVAAGYSVQWMTWGINVGQFS